jgi:ATP-dependent Clp protease protease subunit
MAPSGAVFICRFKATIYNWLNSITPERIQNRSSLVRNDEEVSELLLGNPWAERPIKQYTQVINVSLHHFYIIGEIEEPDRYIDMINTIKSAEPHDKIFLYLNTPGGCLSTTIQIISAMKQSQAEVTTVIEGEVFSAGTFIFLAGDSYIVNDNCSFMIHNYSHGILGKGGEVARQVKFTDEYFNQLAKSFYKDFMTPTEIEDICQDRDFWMGSEEVIKRLEKFGAGVMRASHDPRELEKEAYDGIEEELVPRKYRRKSKAKRVEQD